MFPIYYAAWWSRDVQGVGQEWMFGFDWMATVVKAGHKIALFVVASFSLFFHTLPSFPHSFPHNALALAPEILLVTAYSLFSHPRSVTRSLISSFVLLLPVSITYFLIRSLTPSFSPFSFMVESSLMGRCCCSGKGENESMVTTSSVT